MRAVFDTNVLLSGLLWRGAPYQCLLAAEAGLFELVLAEEILDELREKLVNKFGNTDDEADNVIVGIRRATSLIAIERRSGWVLADPDHDKFVETAIVGNAEYIVSGDKHLLNLKQIDGIEIITPREFLDHLNTLGNV